jgi:predicted ATP-dependent endonuclease of OLD family
MDLNWVRIKGYKRFKEVTLNTFGKTIAITGPNEAGKSSILQALNYLTSDRKFLPAVLNRSMQSTLKDDEIIIEAAFLLDDTDREALAEIHEGTKVKWFYIKKQLDGKRIYEISPALERPVNGKNKLEYVLKDFLENQDSNFSDLQTEFEPFFQQAHVLLESLEAFEKSSVSHSVSLKSIIDGQDVNQKSSDFEEILELIDNFVAQSRMPDPNLSAKEILSARIPKFLIFDDHNRTLPSSYDLSTLPKSGPPVSLRNLFTLSNLDLDLLLKAANMNDSAQCTTLLSQANDRISEIVEGKWSQANVKVQIQFWPKRLTILVEEKISVGNEKKRLSTNLEDRSDGLRQFIALLNFLESQNAENPILLIDEAETHLHYDAQADLMQIFARQPFVSKIIYTTHSAGCLPEDIGSGIRIIVPDRGKENSTIENHFWADHTPGFSSLLFRMGASALAFVPMRKAVFVEGPTDMILLPTMFKQVIKRAYLGFQIVPGLSEASKTGLSLLRNEAPTVAFLVDNDEGGQEIKEKLEKSGVCSSTIFTLPNQNHCLVLEDYIEDEIYLEAVNIELQSWTSISQPFCSEDLPISNRPRALKQWCEARGSKTISKRVLAYRLLDFASNEEQKNLVKAEFNELFEELYQSISTMLEI